MTFNMRYLPGQLPDAAKRVELCHDQAKTTVWLELTNTDYIMATFATSPAAFGGRPGLSRQVGVQFAVRR